MAAKLKVKVGDTVKVISGEDKNWRLVEIVEKAK